MAAKEVQPGSHAKEKPEGQDRSVLIGRHVLHALGQPGAPHRLQVRLLWDDHYRVNVLVGEDASTTRIAHSYFLVADGAGNVLASTPKLTKEY